MRTLRFHHVDQDALIAYSKHDPATGDTVVVVVSLDPPRPAKARCGSTSPALGFDPGEQLVAHDEVTGETYDWGESNYVRLDPAVAAAHVISLQRRLTL